MQLGVYCSSNKPYLWGSLIKTLSNNSVDWNLCIAGPHPPVEPLPGNVKYIQTNVKPAQCFFIAEQNTVGDYVMNIPDDVELSFGCLDNLISMVDSKMTIASPRYLRNSHNIFRHKSLRRFITLDFSMSLFAMMHRDTFDSIGIDKHYVALNWNLDIDFELVCRGGKIIISETGFGTDIKGTSNMCKRFGDYAYLTEMWFDRDKVRDKRKNSIDAITYSDNILELSQGRKDEMWA